MKHKKGVMTRAEGSQHEDFKADATMVLNSRVERGYVLRTAFGLLNDWKSKYAKNISPFYPRVKGSTRETALIDNEIWVFRIDATKVIDIIDAVTIGANFFKVQPSYFLESIYVKNLNIEGERTLDTKTLVRMNMNLYKEMVSAIKKTCEHFNVRNGVCLYVYSSNVNYKIPALTSRSDARGRC